MTLLERDSARPALETMRNEGACESHADGECTDHEEGECVAVDHIHDCDDCATLVVLAVTRALHVHLPWPRKTP